MKRKHKSYSKPKRPFDKARIDEEAKIKAEYGLKNKKEIWKAEAKINSMREKAKKLVRADESEKQKLFDKLNKIGLKVESLAEVLSLNIRDFLERRLQTVLVRKNMAPTMKTARQFITHKKVLVDGRIVNIPSYQVKVNDVIGVREKSKSLSVIEESLSNSSAVYEWLSWNAEKKEGTFVSVPERTQIPENINEQFIVELYSK